MLTFTGRYHDMIMLSKVVSYQYLTDIKVYLEGRTR